MPRIQRAREDIEQELLNQIKLLHSSSILYDAGLNQEAKKISTTLRVLLHDTKSMKSLLTQLDLKRIKFLNTSKPLMDVFFNGYCGLVNLMISQKERAVEYNPIFNSNHSENWISFKDWWENPIIIDTERRVFSRKDIIINVADTDGGAHVDAGFEVKYMDLARNNSLGWTANYENQESTPIHGDPVLTSLRAIAYEILITFQKELKNKITLPGIKIEQIEKTPKAPNVPKGISTKPFTFNPEEGGQAFVLRGGQEKALEAWDFYIKSAGNDLMKIKGMFNKGVVLLTIRREREALLLFNKICEIVNDVSILNDYCNQLEKWYRKKNKFKPIQVAIDIFNNRIASFYFHEGLVFANQDRFEEALECFNTAIKLNPNNVGAYGNKGIVLENLDRFGEALETYNTAIKLIPNEVAIYNNKGNILFKLNRSEEALETFNFAIKLNSKCDIAYFNKGNVLGKITRFEEALEAFNTAIKLNPNNAVFFYNKSIVLKSLGRFEEARDVYNVAIKLNPTLANST